MLLIIGDNPGMIFADPGFSVILYLQLSHNVFLNTLPVVVDAGTAFLPFCSTYS